jgi:hypothetical protein
MLNAARAALVEFGALEPSDRLPPFWARMSGNLVLMVYPKGSSFYLVKIGIRTVLDREFRGLSIAHAAMPQNVPRPIGVTRQGSFQVLVTQGIPHRQLIFRRGQGMRRIFERGIINFLAASTGHFEATSSDSAMNVREALRKAADATGWVKWRDYWDRIAPLIAPMPRILQHGDLAMTNIAVAGDELVIFDWEDFGLVDIVGFDLAVVLLSLHGFDTARLRKRLAAPTMEARLVSRGCARLNMSPDLFLELFPVYLSAFLEIKQSGGYDPTVNARAVAALNDWVRTGPAHVAAA